MVKDVTFAALLEAVAEDLQSLFAGYTLVNSAGEEQTLHIYQQDLPVRDYEEDVQEPPPEPYIIVRLRSGGVAEEQEPQKLEILLLICVFDEDKNRQGYRDAMRILFEIYRHYAACNLLGRRWLVRYPINWTMQDEDTHPYYFAALSFNVEAPAIRKELPEC